MNRPEVGFFAFVVAMPLGLTCAAAQYWWLGRGKQREELGSGVEPPTLNPHPFGDPD
jgi:hypothetical protein